MTNDHQTYGSNHSNESIQAQFSRRAHRYQDSQVHAHGEDLRWIVEAAALSGVERVLDVASGAGHTAFALAPFAKTVVGADLTDRMVESATGLAEDRGLANVQFVVSDAVHMPFPSHFFHLVTCRLAAHHFVDPDVVALEISRVLRPGGQLILVDHIAPEVSEQDIFVNRIDWLRDTSHVREWTAAEWVERFRKVGIQTSVARAWNLQMDMAWWLEQAATSTEHRREIEQLFHEASESTREAFCVEFGADGKPVSFALKAVLLQGHKDL